MEWINPEYADVVAALQETQDAPEADKVARLFLVPDEGDPTD